MIWYILSVFAFSFPLCVFLGFVATWIKDKSPLYSMAVISSIITLYALAVAVLGSYTGVLCAS